MSNVYALKIDQGSTKSFVFNIKDVGGAAFNLTGYDARLQVRRTYGDTATLMNCTLANGKLVMTNAIGGVLTWKALPADSTEIRFATKDADECETVFDLEIQSAIGDVAKPARGTLTISREVTR